MTVYTENLKMVILNEENYLTHGHCAKIYKEGEFVKKVYYDYCLEKNRLDKNVNEIIKKIDSSYILKIHTLYYDYFKRHVMGYLATYYEPANIDILEEDVTYTLENLHNIKLLFDKLASYSIKVDDVKTLNTILQKDKIILLDPDLFEIVKCSEESCIKHNNQELIHLFKSIYKEALLNYLSEFKNKNPYFILDDLFKVNSDNLEEEISKKLIKYKYPIEYFRTK